MSGRKRNIDPERTERSEAPGIDEEEEFGKNATDEERKKGDSTKVTRLIYDEYNPF